MPNGQSFVSGGVSTAARSAVSASAAASSIGMSSGAQAGSNGSTYNINVTGALDKEGVARQIVEIINDSNARGGGGGSGAFATL
jgi:hypothetical protein